MTHIPMAQFHYHFSAARLPRNNVVLYITTNGVPLHLTSEEIGAVWRDIVHCFVHVKQHLKLSQYKHLKLSQYFVERSPPTDRYFIEQERLVG